MLVAPLLVVPLVFGCARPPLPADPPDPPAPAPVWPEEGAALVNPVLEVPEGWTRPTVFLSAGHGAPGNDGNLGAWCTREQDFTLAATDALAALLDQTGQVDAVRARTGEARPTYAARLRHLDRVGATTMIELHSDVRSDGLEQNRLSPAGEPCWRDDREPGFTVLVADRGPAGLVADRLDLARAVAAALTEAGFTPWTGDNYGELYDADEVPGVWRDRRNLFVLRKPEVPSIIVETHNAIDTRESRRWEAPETHDTFGRAVLAALFAYYSR